MIVLKRGDKIHLAFPLNGSIEHMTPLEQVRAAQEQADYFCSQYAALGIDVVISGGNSRLTAPVVVAVFRDTE